MGAPRYASPMAALSKAELAALAQEVTIDAHDEDEQAGILAIWARSGIRQAIGVVDLPLPEPPPARAEWTGAYRYWLG